MSKNLTICIPTFNESKNLEGLFKSLYKSDLDLFDYEILLCDSGSDDDTYQVIDRWLEKLKIKTIVTSGANASQNLNAGIRAAKNSIFCWIAPRSRVSSNYFSIGCKYLKLNKNKYCVIGPSVVAIPRSNNVLSNFIAKFFVSPFFMGPSKWKRSIFYNNFEGVVSTVYIGFFWTNDLRDICGFNNSLQRRQDIDLLHRLQILTNKKLFNTFNLKATYVLKHDTLIKICYRSYFQGKYAILYLTTIKLVHLLPFFFLVLFLSLNFIIPSSSLFLIGFYGLLVVLAGFLETFKFLSMPIALLTFPLVHLSYVVGNIHGLAKKTMNSVKGK